MFMLLIIVLFLFFVSGKIKADDGLIVALAGFHVTAAAGRGRQLGHDRGEGEGDHADCQVNPRPQRNLQRSRHYDNRPGIPRL